MKRGLQSNLKYTCWKGLLLLPPSLHSKLLNMNWLAMHIFGAKRFHPAHPQLLPLLDAPTISISVLTVQIQS